MCSAATPPSASPLKRVGRHRVVLLPHSLLARLLHRVGESVLQRPLRPRGAIVGSLRRGLGQQLQLDDRHGALAQRIADAVRTGIPAADHHYVLAGSGDLGGLFPRHQAVALVEIVHREVHPPQLAPRDRQVAGHARAGGEHHRVEACAQLPHGEVAPDVHPAAQLDALLDELLHAALDDALLDLEVRHAEAHQPAGGLVALEECHVVPGAAQLLSGRHAGRAAADDGDALAGSNGAARAARL